MPSAWTLFLSAALLACTIGWAAAEDECVADGPASAETSCVVSAKPGAGRQAAGVSPVEDVFSLLQTHSPKRAPTAAGTHVRALQDSPGQLEPECIDDSLDWKFLSPESLVPIPPLIYVKTHKTGSTTTFMIVARLTDRRNLRMMHLMPLPQPLRNLGYPGPFPGPRPDDPPAHQYDTIANHAVFGSEAMRSYVKTSPEPFFLTVIREPGHQAVSAFNHFGGLGDAPTWEKHMDLVRDMRLYYPGAVPFGWHHFVNPQAHDLGWYQWVGSNRGSDKNSTKVAEFLSKLDADFASARGFVIINEYYDQGLVLLRRRLGLDMREVAYVTENSRPYPFEPTEEMYQEARDALPVDMALYAHYNRTFQQLWASEYAAHAQELEEELAELQALNERLQAACQAALDSAMGTTDCPVPQFAFLDGGISHGYGRDYLEMKAALNCTRRPQ